jgi:pilus assembly protein FimV
MAYNKSKFVEAAQKLLNQGKVAQAISEYQQILKYEPRDQVTLMTIGELYIRQGETFQAIEYFERLAQLFVSDGFLTKAIAVYKRIAKLAPEEIRPLEKLADLYVQQGVMSEARPLFLQLAELHLKNSRQPEAVALLKKLLLAEPDNLRIQIRLADLYQAMGQAGEALEAYISAAQRALARGDQAECERLADKALQINSSSLDALIVKARAFSSVGSANKAAEILERVPDLEKGGEPAELLLDLYVKGGKWDEATALALRIFSTDEKNFGATQKVTESLLESGQGERAMSVLSRIRIPMIDAGEHEGVVHLLNELAVRLPGRLEPLDWLVDTYGRTSDSFRLPDAMAQLGDALVASGKLERAKETFEQLVNREPESESAKRKLNAVLRKLGLTAGEPEPEPMPEPPAEFEGLQAELPEAPSAKIRPALSQEAAEELIEAEQAPLEPRLDDETEKFIVQSLTDVDLFASYGLTQKAIGLLEAILRRAPMHTPTLEKLLDFVLGAGDDRRTAELAGQLEHIHAGRGDIRNAERFGELRRRFQRAAGLSDEEIAAAVAAAMPQPVETLPFEEDAALAVSGERGSEGVEGTPVELAVAIPAPQATEEAPEIEMIDEAPPAGSAEEVDLSEEWASLLGEAKQPARPDGKPAEKEAPGEVIKLPELSVTEGAAEKHSSEPAAAHPPGQSGATEFEVPMEAVKADEQSATLAAPGVTAAPDKDLEAREELLPDEELTALPLPEHAEAALPGTPTTGPEFEVDQEFELVFEPEDLVPPHAMLPPVASPEEPAEPVPVEDVHNHQGKLAAIPSNGQEFSSDEFLSDLAKEIDELGLGDFAAPSKEAAGSLPSASEQPEGEKAQPQPVGFGADSGPLKEVFEEFRAELGEMGSEDEDLETHYNLGIAFREMGLLEEAIGEFQKVAKASDRGKVFRYAMQCCTLLGLAFMEKGQPGIAAIWYERALQTPGMDTETKLALRYDLGVAQESAGDLDAALKSFSQVYAVNIDYRDVADRINSLQKPAR